MFEGVPKRKNSDKKKEAPVTEGKNKVLTL